MPYKVNRKRPCQTPEYMAWNAMWTRVKSKTNAKHLKNYSGKGVTVCDRWKDPKAFIADMGPKPSPEHSLDRIENSRGYSPENCRWATRQEQSWNRCRTKWVSFNGETLPGAEWARRIGITGSTFYARLRRMPVERAVTMPKQK